MTNAQIIWKYFKGKGFSDCGIAGLMGNLYAESGLNSINLQNTYEKKLKMTDAGYTSAVDDGRYKNFVKDGLNGHFGAENKICFSSVKVEVNPLEI